MSAKASKIPKMIPNPEYLASEEFKGRVEYFKNSLAIHGESVEDFFPEDFDKKLPAEGGWIMLLMSVQVGKAVGDDIEHITVPHLSIWYATPTRTKHARTFDKMTFAMTQAIIRHPQGDVHIWPHEYKRVNIADFLEFTEDDGFCIRFLNQNANVFDEKKLFYLRSRGVSKAEAQRMLLPEMNDPTFCYFEFAPEIAGAFTEGTGTPFLASVNHQRRASALKRRGAQ